MEIEHKQFAAKVQPAGDEGIVTALVSCYSIDRANEKVVPGAFKQSLQRKLPKMCWAHDWKQIIGKTIEARETDAGLVIKGQFNLETQRGREAYSDCKFHSENQEWSIGYRVVRDSFDKKAGIRNLEEIEIFEVSAVLSGMNPDTTTLSIKDAANASSEEDMSNTEVVSSKNADGSTRMIFPGSPAGGLAEVKVDRRSIGKRIFEAKEIQDYLHSNATGQDSLSVTLPDVDFKTLLTSSGGWPVENRRSDVMVPFPTVAPRISDIIPTITTKSNAWVWMEETTFSDNAGTVLEGAAKPEATLALTERTAQIRKVAVWIAATSEQLEDQESMQEYIDSRLGYMVQRKVDTQIVSGDGIAPNMLGILSTPGIGTQAKGTDPTPDAIAKAMTKVRDAGGEPSAVLLNPADHQEILLLRTTDGIYISTGGPWDSGPARIWGVPVIISSSVPSGTGIVGDFANFTRLIVRKGLTSQIGYKNDDFVKNLKTFLAEIRLTFVALRPSCLVTVTGI